ncbi:MAG: glycerol kinase GlpK [Erysipelotrichaceae bacterium]
MEEYILSIDQGTTSSRAIIFNHNSEIIAQVNKEFTQYYPYSGWVEHDANEIWLSVLSVISEVFIKSQLRPEQIRSIGITNQRETTVVWDKKSGLPIYHAICWQSRQTSDICDELRAKGYEKMIKDKTGLVLDAYFSASKIKWILDNVPMAREKANNDELLCGTIDTWLMYKLSGGTIFKTDYSNASRTMLYNIYDKQWDDELLELFEVPRSMVAEVCDSSGVFGQCAPYHFFNYPVTISGVAGDQQAALFGQNCLKLGEAKNTYGTGCFLLMNTKDKPIKSEKGLITTLAWGINGQVDYALEGSIFIGGSAISWLKDGIKIINKPQESEEKALKVEDNQQIYVVPAFVGLGAPYWNDKATGAIYGLTRATSDNHLCKATLEAIAYQTKDILDVMALESNIDLTRLKVDGKAASNDYLMQFQSDILQSEVVRVSQLETTALGACYLAGLSVNYFKDMDDICNSFKVDRVFKPQMSKEEAQRLYDGWKNAVETTCFYCQKKV